MLRRVLFCTLLLTATPAWAQEASPTPAPDLSALQSRAQNGVFRVLHLKDKLYYQIPKQALDRDFLLVTQVARTRAFAGYGGDPVDQRVVRWHRQDNKILLLDIDYGLTADPKKPMGKGVEAANNPSILFSFPIASTSDQGAALIDVTRMFVTESIELTPKYLLGAHTFDASRSFLESARAFPENIEVEATLTFTLSPDRPPTPGPRPFSRPMRPGTASVRVHTSMVKLPDQPMMPRRLDSRVGYFTVGQFNYDKVVDRVEAQRYICRWRLEKSDPKAELSEPVKPIVFYIDPATPSQWVPYIKAGVEKWQSAFEEAGFKNAIQAREAPRDPGWSPEDARYSVIRWLPSEVGNAYGPHISDPRTGEILEADIHMFHNILDLLRSWYLTQVGPLDARARSLPFPDELMGKLIEYVVAHEVGHSLGLPHNMKASSMYPLAKLRDPEWIKKMGHTPTLMDYARFNYVAQPEDHIPPDDLIPGIGPYDKFSIMWGYKPIPGARTPEEEAITLDAWARQQDKTPWLRFSTPGAFGLDPGDQTEAVGDADAVQATTLGLRNLKRVMAHLISATGRPGESYAELRLLYLRSLGQWMTEVNHVAALIGGVETHNKHAGQQGTIYSPVAATRQQAAVKFLIDNVFHAPDWLAPREIIDRIQPAGGLERISIYQRALLVYLTDASRLQRMSEQSTQNPKAYAPAAYLAALRAGIFSELKSKAAKAGTLPRQRLHATFIDALGHHLDSGQADISALARSELLSLQEQLKRAQATAQGSDKAHWSDLLERLRREFDPDRRRTSASPVSQPRLQDHHNCWHDYQLELSELEGR